VHPPLLVAFNPKRGEYARTEALCTARWAQSQGHHVAGQMCGQQAEHEAGDLWVCEYHYQRLRGWAKDLPRRDHRADMMRLAEFQEEVLRNDRELAKQRMAQRREEAKLERELARERILAEEAARAELSLVYYVRRESDSLVKIGTSRTLAARLATLARAHGPLVLMATHGGGQKEEHETHVKFKELRVEGEWFRPELVLIQHVVKLRRAGDPPRLVGLPECMSITKLNAMLAGLHAERKSVA